jgi:predicted NUDIX family NTP pyrophosphohydrolase
MQFIDDEMETSAGIIVWKRKDGDVQFFLCSPGGPLYRDRELWCFPKGHVEDGESEFGAACREFEEETGIRCPSINRNDYEWHGGVRQRNNKRVHVFSIELVDDDIDPDSCRSNTFEWEDGFTYPEIEKYAWMTLDEIMEADRIRAYDYIYEKIRREALEE